MYFHLTPQLRKKPSKIVLHIGSNNCTRDNSNEIIEKLEKLKIFIMDTLPGVKLYMSSLLTRSDNSKARLTAENTNRKLTSLGLEVINNDNINENHLGKKGLHLRPNGTSRLATNFIATLKR